MARAGRKRIIGVRTASGQLSRAKELSPGAKKLIARRGLTETDYDWHSTIWWQEVWRINWRDYDLPFSGIYVISPDTMWPCKIGISANPRKRLDQLQTSHWLPLRVVGYRMCESVEDATQLESAVHDRLDDLGIALNGEWFDIRFGIALWHILDVASEIGLLVTDIPFHRPPRVESDLNALIDYWRARKAPNNRHEPGRRFVA